MRRDGGIGVSRRGLIRLGAAGWASLRANGAWASGSHGAAPEGHAAPPAEAPAPAPKAPSPPSATQGTAVPIEDRTIGGLYAANAVSGVALEGFDPVTYFLPGAVAPEGGRAGIEWRHAGVDWRFASLGNREAFRRDTAVYLPCCGGFDPVGIAADCLVRADPLVFALVGGRLWLFRDAERREAADPALLAEAERRYPALLAAPG